MEVFKFYVMNCAAHNNFNQQLLNPIDKNLWGKIHSTAMQNRWVLANGSGAI